MSSLPGTVLLLAAGFGTRLRPLTDQIPKAMVPVHGQPTLLRSLRWLEDQGIQRVIINTHYRPESIRDLLANHRWHFTWSESHEPEILGTGGAVAAASPLLRDALDDLGEDCFWILNCDVLAPVKAGSFSDSDLASVASGQKAALFVLRPDAEAEQYGAFELDEQNRIVRMLDRRMPDRPANTPLMFTGIHLLHRAVFDYVKPEFGSIFSQYYLPAWDAGKEFAGLVWDGPWFDLGTLDKLKEAEEWVAGSRECSKQVL